MSMSAISSCPESGFAFGHMHGRQAYAYAGAAEDSPAHIHPVWNRKAGHYNPGCSGRIGLALKDCQGP